MNFRLIKYLTIASSGVVALAGPAVAQWLPDSTVRIVVPFAPGGSADVLARMLAQQISKSSGQKTIVENRPGGGTVPATEAVARSVPDGGTLLLLANSFVINPSLRSNLPYDPLKSFEPICHLAYAPTVFAVHRSSPYRSLNDLLVAARAPGAALTMAGVGPATSVHISIEMLKRAANTSYVYVAFPGGTPAVTNLLGGHVTSALANFSEVQAHLGGDLRPLAIGADKRIATHPDVPTLAEAGYPDIDATTWFGMVAPVGTPKNTMSQIISEAKSALDAPEVRGKLAAAGLVPAGICSDGFAAFLTRQLNAFSRAVSESGLKAQ